MKIGDIIYLRQQPDVDDPLIKVILDIDSSELLIADPLKTLLEKTMEVATLNDGDLIIDGTTYIVDCHMPKEGRHLLMVAA
jgi:Mg2+/Co2+ transporter CorC